MPEITIEIGGRNFEVTCQEGEEQYLHSAAGMLNEEATVLAAQIGRTPEPRMLLMAGLMLADKTAGLQDKLRDAQAKLAEKEADLAKLRGSDSKPAKPEKIEVPVVPEGLTDALSEIAEQAEALADMVAAKSD